jgi:hypothetical protein
MRSGMTGKGWVSMSSTRSFSLFAALALGAFATEVFAQAGSLIYWHQATVEPNPSTHYRVVGTGGISFQFHTFPSQTASPSSLDFYPGGRQFFHDAPGDPIFDLIPGTNRVNHFPLLMSENVVLDYAPVIAVFTGPEFIDSADPLWSNDNADTFMSFQAFDTGTFGRILYRFNGPITDFFGSDFDPNSPFFFPFLSGDPFFGPDPRLDIVTTYDADTFAVGWNRTGTKVILQSPSAAGLVTKIFNTAGGTTTIVNNPAVSGFVLIDPVYSPTTDLIYANARNSAGVRGIASFNPATGLLTYLIREGGSGISRIAGFRGPKVSPNGTTLTFTMLQVPTRGVNRGKLCPSLVTMPIGGGRFTVIAVRNPSLSNPFEPTGWVLP